MAKRRYHLRANVQNIGDVSIEYGSLDMDVTVYQQVTDSTGTIIHVEAPTDEDWTGEDTHGGFKLDARWTIYRTDNARELPTWADLEAVAACVGYDGDLPNMFTCAIDGTRARAWEMLASYYGWDELDPYPLRLSYAEAIRYARRHIVTFTRESAA